MVINVKQGGGVDWSNYISQNAFDEYRPTHFSLTVKETKVEPRQMSAGGNVYTTAKGDPKVLETRKKRVASLDDTIRRMQVQNAGRRPNWSEERILVYDRIALESGKRCVLWDDTGNGFFLVSHLLKKFAFLEYKLLNWDWSQNRPQTIPQTDEKDSKDGCKLQGQLIHSGWWENIKRVLQPPLIDPTVKEEDLGAWLDAHTMNIHARLSSLVPKIRPALPPSPGFIIEDDEYWNILQSTKIAEREAS